jgi:formate/nitrite transporter FocA (FNT family)
MSDAEPTAGQLSEQESQKADEEQSLDAKTTYEVIRREGTKELARTNAALGWSGLAAGLSMGFSLVAQGVLRASLPDAPWRPLVVKFGYSIGFLIVILGSQQLFTENTLMPIVPALAERREKRVEAWRNVGRLWAIVFVANVVGAALFAFVAAHTEMVSPDVHRAFGEIARDAIGEGILSTFVRAIFAGWLIAIMVWMMPAATGSEVLVIVLITYVIGTAHFSHIIAGSVDALYGVFIGITSWSEFCSLFFFPTLIGNIVGGVTLVAALNHAQVKG